MISFFTEKPGKPVASPGTHRNEFPTRYSLAGCSPAEPASASLAVLILQPSVPARPGKSCERYVSKFRVVSKKGAPQFRRFRHFTTFFDWLGEPIPSTTELILSPMVIKVPRYPVMPRKPSRRLCLPGSGTASFTAEWRPSRTSD